MSRSHHRLPIDSIVGMVQRIIESNGQLVSRSVDWSVSWWVWINLMHVWSVDYKYFMSRQTTLLARLAFADPDKQLRKHDMACSFLCQPCVLEKIVGILDRRLNGTSNIQQACLQTDVVLSKGQQQYKQIIGFIDGVIEFPTIHNDSMQQKVINTKLYVEVKINPVTVGEILRQIKLYRTYIEPCNYHNAIKIPFLLAHAFELKELEVALLESADIICVQLGPQFERWCQEKFANQTNQTNEANVNRLVFWPNCTTCSCTCSTVQNKKYKWLLQW